MGKHINKRDLVKRHFSVRCMERLGYIPDEKDLVKKIQAQKLEFLSRQTNRVTKYKWNDPVNNIPCILVYDKERHQIITVLFERIKDDN